MSTIKPLIYIDHNIYDSFIKNELQDLKELILESFQVVYSNENLVEIERSPEYAPRFLDVLSELKAYYMEIVLDDKWNVTDRMRFYNISPRTAYSEPEDQNTSFKFFALFRRENDVYLGAWGALTALLGTSFIGSISLAGSAKLTTYLFVSFHCSMLFTSAMCVIAETGATLYTAICFILGIMLL